MSDLIDRQAAIEALRTCYDTETVTMDNGDEYINYEDAVGEIEQLPPAQPEPCGDAVSRKAVKDGFVEMCNLICPYTEKQRHAMCGSCLLGTAFDVLEATQSVTPKQRTGKWLMNDHIGTFKIFTCDKCGWNSEAPFNFCPNCGDKKEIEVE